jgi:hypothetical protein
LGHYLLEERILESFLVVFCLRSDRRHNIYYLGIMPRLLAIVRFVWMTNNCNSSVIKISVKHFFVGPNGTCYNGTFAIQEGEYCCSQYYLGNYKFLNFTSPKEACPSSQNLTICPTVPDATCMAHVNQPDPSNVLNFNFWQIYLFRHTSLLIFLITLCKNPRKAM